MNWALIYSILIFYGILIIVNIPAPYFGLEFESGSKPKLWYAPPGFVIPIIWFILFTLLGIARFNLIEIGHANYQWWLFALAFLCATYAYYTLGLTKITGVSSLWFGLSGNIVVILLAAFVALKLQPISTKSSLLVLPIIIWTAYASIIVVGEMKLQKLI